MAMHFSALRRGKLPKSKPTPPRTLRKPSQKVFEALTLLNILKVNSREEDRDGVNKVLEVGLNEEGDEATFLVLECVRYYDSIGDALKCLQLSQIGLERAIQSGSLNLKRKACNTIAVASARLCDYEAACLYHERAITLSSEISDPCLEFASLCNVVAMLQEMGLIHEAKELSIKLSCYPDGSAKLDYLHLQNAVNGFALAAHCHDLLAIERFNKIAMSKQKTSESVDNTLVAYVIANNVEYLVKSGRAELAYSTITAAVENVELGNLRAETKLSCARAECVIALGDTEKINQSKLHLTALLQTPETLALHRETILRTLVRLYACDRTVKGKKKGLHYLRCLIDHLINVKHRQFFERMSRPGSDSANEVPHISRFSYDITPKLAEQFSPNATSLLTRYQITSADHLQHLASDFSSAARAKLERQLRSKNYDLAEDWAMAADSMSERAGIHCLEVGQFAGIIASKLGKPDRECVMLDMACRLHDLGKSAMCDIRDSLGKWRLEDNVVTREHALAGHKMLSTSTDPIFMMAADIALHHHEWWNGCGLPSGLKGEEIPLDARICLVSDLYITFLSPSSPYVGWQETNAVEQIIAMAGIQVDPGLIFAFSEATKDFRHLIEVDNRQELNMLRLARTKMLNATASKQL